VNPLFYYRRTVLAGSILATALTLSACGQIGPLYMPRIPADPDRPAPPADIRPPPLSSPLPAQNISPIPPSYSPSPVSQ
jgi:predicted small lipoprotein YifL